MFIFIILFVIPACHVCDIMELVYSNNFFPMQLYLYSAEKQKYFSVL